MIQSSTRLSMIALLLLLLVLSTGSIALVCDIYVDPRHDSSSSAAAIKVPGVPTVATLYEAANLVASSSVAHTNHYHNNNNNNNNSSNSKHRRCSQRQMICLATQVTHVLTQTLALDERHSCTAWQAVDGGSAKVRGGVALPWNNFAPYHRPPYQNQNGHRPQFRIYVTDLDPSLDLGQLTTGHPIVDACAHAPTADLYYYLENDDDDDDDDNPHTTMTLARHPNIWPNGTRPWFHMRNVTASNAFVRDATDDFAERHAFYTAAGAADDDHDDVWLHGYWTYDWADNYIKVAAIHRDDYIYDNVTTTAHHGFSVHSRYAIVNALAALDAPGEYYLDRRAHRLYVIPPLRKKIKNHHTNNSSSSLPKTAAATWVLSTTPTLLRVAHATDVTVRNVHWSVARGTAVVVTNATRVRLSGGSVTHVGGDWAVQFTNGTTASLVHNVSIADCACGGMWVQGGDRRTLTVAHNRVHHTRIHRFSTWKRTYTPGILVTDVGSTVAHCTIGDAPHMGVVVRNGNDNRIESNTFHDLCHETTDASAFYAGRSLADRGNVLRHNVFANIGPLNRSDLYNGFAGTTAIYLDDMMSGYAIYNTTIRHTEIGVLLGGGRDNDIVNITMMYVNTPFHVDARGIEWLPDQMRCRRLGLFEQELLYFRYKEPPWSDRYPRLVHLFEQGPDVCKPKYNRIDNFTFCHGQANNTFWVDEEGRLANLLLWENSFRNIRQDQTLCNGSNYSSVDFFANAVDTHKEKEESV